MATSRHCSITCRVPSERSCIPFQSNQKRSDRVGLQIWVPVFCIVANMCNHNLSLPRDPQDHCMVAATRSDFYTMSNLADLNNPLTRSFNHFTALPWTCESNLSARDDCEHGSAITIAACGRCAWHQATCRPLYGWSLIFICCSRHTQAMKTWCIRHVCTWAAWMMILTADFFCLGIANPCRVNCINDALVQTSMLVSNTCSIQAQSHFKHLNLRWSTMAKGQLLVRPLAFLNKLLRKPTQSEKKRWLPHKPCYWGKNVRRKFGEKLVQLECIIHILYFCIGSIWFGIFYVHFLMYLINTYIPHIHKGNDFAVLRKYHINKKGKRSEIIPATWGMRSQSCSRNTARAEKLVFGKLSPSRTCAWKRAWSDDQKARAENCFHSRRSIFFRHGTHRAHERTRNLLCTDDLFVVFFAGAISSPPSAPGCNYFTRAMNKNTCSQTFF